MQRSPGFARITAETAQLQLQRIAAEAERAAFEAAAAAEARRAGASLRLHPRSCPAATRRLTGREVDTCSECVCRQLSPLSAVHVCWLSWGGCWLALCVWQCLATVPRDSAARHVVARSVMRCVVYGCEANRAALSVPFRCSTEEAATASMNTLLILDHTLLLHSLLTMIRGKFASLGCLSTARGTSSEANRAIGQHSLTQRNEFKHLLTALMHSN